MGRGELLFFIIQYTPQKRRQDFDPRMPNPTLKPKSGKMTCSIFHEVNGC